MSSLRKSPTKKNKGRQKLKMEKIENESNLKVTFSKRHASIFKKASELCILCGVETLIIVFSPTHKAFSYCHPDVESVTNKFLNGDAPSPSPTNVKFKQMIIKEARNSNIRSLNLELTELNSAVAMEKIKSEELKMLEKKGQKEGWIPSPMEELNLEQLKVLEKTIMNFEKHFDENFVKFLSHDPNLAANLNVTNELYATSGMNVTNILGSSTYVPNNHPPFQHVFNDVKTCFNSTLHGMGGINNIGEVLPPKWNNNSASGFGDRKVYKIGETSVADNICTKYSAPNEFNTWAPDFGNTRENATGGTSVAYNFIARDPNKPLGLLSNDLFMPSYDPDASDGVADPYCQMTDNPNDAMFYGGRGSSGYPSFNGNSGP